VADALSWLGWRSPMRTTAITQLADGINGDPAGWIAATGITPKSLDELLALHPATVQDRWFARLYILKPLAIAVLAAFWITSGLIALGPSRAGAMLIPRLAGASLGVAKGAVLVGAVLDIVLGLAVLVRRHRHAGDLTRLCGGRCCRHTASSRRPARQHPQNIPHHAGDSVCPRHSGRAMMDLYVILKIAHVIGACVLFGTGLGIAFM
jgi:uncharacterized membrane protein